MDSNLCWACGGDLARDAEVCPNCEAPAEDRKLATANLQPRARRWLGMRLMAWLIIIPLVTAVGFALWSLINILVAGWGYGHAMRENFGH